MNEISNEVKNLEPSGTVIGQGEVSVTQTKFRTVETRHLPDNYQERCGANEIAILAELKEARSDFTKRALYIEYQKECRRSGIPDRSSEAFKKKG